MLAPDDAMGCVGFPHVGEPTEPGDGLELAFDPGMMILSPTKAAEGAWNIQGIAGMESEAHPLFSAAQEGERLAQIEGVGDLRRGLMEEFAAASDHVLGSTFLETRQDEERVDRLLGLFVRTCRFGRLEKRAGRLAQAPHELCLFDQRGGSVRRCEIRCREVDVPTPERIDGPSTPEFIVRIALG